LVQGINGWGGRPGPVSESLHFLAETGGANSKIAIYIGMFSGDRIGEGNCAPFPRPFQPESILRLLPARATAHRQYCAESSKRAASLSSRYRRTCG
jgi:hypothetical protein